MTIQEALDKQLDVHIFHRNTDPLTTPLAIALQAAGRVVEGFQEVIGATGSIQTTVSVLVSSRPASHGTAAAVKKQKTVQQFIQGENNA
jgi:hypothetical protein